MSNPYESPTAEASEIPKERRKRGRLKHFVFFPVIWFILNSDRFFGNPVEMEKANEISYTGSVLALMLLYGVGYFVVTRFRRKS